MQNHTAAASAAAVAHPRLAVVGYVCEPAPDDWSAPPAWMQRRQIEAWTTARGWRLTVVVAGSFGGPKRGCEAALEQALGQVESGESGGLVVARLRELRVPLRDALLVVERVQAAGGTFVSVGDGIDLSTSSGRSIVRALLSMIEP